MGDDWIDLERVRNRAPKEESPLRGLKSLIVIIILAALAFFMLHKMAKNMVPKGDDAGGDKASAESLASPEGDPVWKRGAQAEIGFANRDWRSQLA